jgi:hypothetical protein
VVECFERAVAVGDFELECLAGLGVVDGHRDVSVEGGPEQLDVDVVGAAAVEFSRQRSDRYVAEPGRLGRDEGMCWECIVGSLDA